MNDSVYKASLANGLNRFELFIFLMNALLFMFLKDLPGGKVGEKIVVKNVMN